MGSQETELPLLSGIGDMRRDMSPLTRMFMDMRGSTDILLGTDICLRMPSDMLVPKMPMDIALALSRPLPDVPTAPALSRPLPDVPTAPALSRPFTDISIAHALSRPLPVGDSILPWWDERGKIFPLECVGDNRFPLIPSIGLGGRMFVWGGEQFVGLQGWW